MQKFESKFEKVGPGFIPEFTGIRVMMMPVVIGDIKSIPTSLDSYRSLFETLFSLNDYTGEVGYITIDEKTISPTQSHRRSGIHVDGVYRGAGGSWGGGGGWGGGGPRPNPPTPKPDEPDSPVPKPVEKPIELSNRISPNGTGFLTVSSVQGCRAWQQYITGNPGDEGECDHLREQLRDECATLLEANTVYWLDPFCVHESIPMKNITSRQFVRLSYPSVAPWFEGYDINPLGVKPTGPILPRRQFMDA